MSLFVRGQVAANFIGACSFLLSSLCIQCQKLVIMETLTKTNEIGAFALHKLLLKYLYSLGTRINTR